MTACSLVIETSTPRASIARVDPDGVIRVREFHSDRHHNSLMFDPLRELLDTGRQMPLSLVLVGSGPGSYSGTRVGIAAAQGVAIAMGCPAVAVPSILAVASVNECSHCLAIGDARRRSFWHATTSGPHLTSPPALCDAAELASTIHRTLSAGGTVFTLDDPVRFPLATDLASEIKLESPGAIGLWQAWGAATDETRRTWSQAIPQPIYLKPPHVTGSNRPPLV